MRIIRVAIMAAALSGVSGTLAAAQDTDAPPAGMRRGGAMGGRLLEGITLSDAQKAKQATIREKYMPQMTQIMSAVRSTGTPPDSATRAQMMQLMTAYNAEMRAILTPDQQAIFDKNVAADRERRARMNRPPGN